jgi:hypothetical protein
MPKDTSASQELAGVLRDRAQEDDNYEAAMRRSLAQKPFPKTDGRYLSREETNDRARLR